MFRTNSGGFLKWGLGDGVTGGGRSCRQHSQEPLNIQLHSSLHLFRLMQANWSIKVCNTALQTSRVGMGVRKRICQCLSPGATWVTRGQPRQDIVQFTSNNIASVFYLRYLFVYLFVLLLKLVVLWSFCLFGFSCNNSSVMFSYAVDLVPLNSLEQFLKLHMILWIGASSKLICEHLDILWFDLSAELSPLGRCIRLWSS